MIQIPGFDSMTGYDRGTALVSAAKKGHADTVIALLIDQTSVYSEIGSQLRDKILPNLEPNQFEFIIQSLSECIDKLHFSNDNKVILPLYIGKAFVSATENGHTHVMDTLLSYTVDSPIEAIYMQKALIQAAIKGHEVAINKLIKDQGMSPSTMRDAFLKAQEKGHYDICLTILAQKNTPRYLSGEFLNFLISVGRTDVVHKVSDTVDNSYRGWNIIKAAEEGKEEILEILIGSDMYENPAEELLMDIASALHIATKCGYEGIRQKLLLKYGQNLSKVDIGFANDTNGLEVQTGDCPDMESTEHFPLLPSQASKKASKQASKQTSPSAQIFFSFP